MQRLADERFGDLLSSLASKTPAPGGGAAGAMLGATAAALAGMVVAYSLGKKAHESDQAMLERAADRLGPMRDRFLALAAQDADAYTDLNRLQRLEPTDPVRITDEPAALRRAIDAPESARTLAMDLLGLVESLVGRSNRYLASDLAIAAVTAEAAAVAAGWNVRINAPGLPAEDRAAALERVASGDRDAASIRGRVEAACGAS